MKLLMVNIENPDKSLYLCNLDLFQYLENKDISNFEFFIIGSLGNYHIDFRTHFVNDDLNSKIDHINLMVNLYSNK